jgi:thiol-disulfide isomerase/thioredoxin
MAKKRFISNFWRRFFTSCLMGFSAFAVILPVATPAQARALLQIVEDKPQAPKFSLKNLAGEVVKSQDFAGKVVVINFWATWCPPCRAEMPSMEKAAQLLKDRNVVFIGVHVGKKTSSVGAFVKEFKLTFPIVLDIANEYVGRWPLRGLPSTFIVDKQGKLAYKAIGGRKWDDVEILRTLTLLGKRKP